MSSTVLPAPYTPPECELRDYKFMPVEINRLLGSEFHSNCTDAEWRAGVTLWLRSYHQVPAGSLPDNDMNLARLADLGTAVNVWRKLRTNALRGWVKCSDGRLYHAVVCEKVLEGWIGKLKTRKSSAAGNAKRYGYAFDPAPFDAAIEDAGRRRQALNPSSGLDGKRNSAATEKAPAGTEKTSQETETGRERETGRNDLLAPLEGQTQDSKPPVSLPKTAKKRAIPELFPHDSERLWAIGHWREEGRDDLVARVEQEMAQFRDHHAREHSKFVDWPAAWRLWARNAVKFNKKPREQNNGNGHSNGPARPASSFADSFTRAIRSRGPGGLLPGGSEEIVVPAGGARQG